MWLIIDVTTCADIIIDVLSDITAAVEASGPTLSTMFHHDGRRVHFVIVFTDCAADSSLRHD